MFDPEPRPLRRPGTTEGGVAHCSNPRCCNKVGAEPGAYGVGMQGWAQSVAGRVLGIVFVLVALPIMVVTASLWLPMAAVIDLATGRWRLPTVRLGLFGVVYLVHEWIGMARAFELTVAGRRREREPHNQVQAWWLSSLLRWTGRLLGVRVEWPEVEFPDGRFILASRHASAVDAIVPSIWVNTIKDRPVHYVLKAELGFDPCLGIFGRRLGNHFIRRGADRDQELAAIAEMGAGALPRSACVIFPEGTYANERTRARVQRSLAAKGPSDALDLSHELAFLLPPKPAGLLTLLDALPDADVVFVGHVGLEAVGYLSRLRHVIPLRRPVQLMTWNVPRHLIPDGEAERTAWLNDQWRLIDAWVADRLASGGTG